MKFVKKCCIWEQISGMKSASGAPARPIFENNRILFRYTDNLLELCCKNKIMTYSNSENKEKIMQRYVDLLKNSGFKAVFGDRNNKEVVKSVINALLPAHRKVEHIEYAPTDHQGPTLISKEFQYDFICKGTDGTSFIVEVQRYKDDCWFKRCVSYTCRAYDGNNRSGEDYDVSPVYLIGLMEDKMMHHDTEFWKDRYLSEYTFRENECHDLQDETIVLIFAELGRFHKTEADCTSDLDKMCYLLKHMGSFESQPPWLQQEVYTRIFDACEISGYDRDKLKRLQEDMYDERKRNSELKTAKRLGFEEGEAKGRIEGQEEATRDNVRRLLEAGIAIEAIVSALGLSEEVVARYQQA